MRFTKSRLEKCCYRIFCRLAEGAILRWEITCEIEGRNFSAIRSWKRFLCAFIVNDLPDRKILYMRSIEREIHWFHQQLLQIDEAPKLVYVCIYVRM